MLNKGDIFISDRDTAYIKYICVYSDSRTVIGRKADIDIHQHYKCETFDPNSCIQIISDGVKEFNKSQKLLTNNPVSIPQKEEKKIIPPIEKKLWLDIPGRI